MREPCFKMIWYFILSLPYETNIDHQKNIKSLAFAIFYHGRIVKQDEYTKHPLSNALQNTPFFSEVVNIYWQKRERLNK